MFGLSNRLILSMLLVGAVGSYYVFSGGSESSAPVSKDAAVPSQQTRTRSDQIKAALGRGASAEHLSREAIKKFKEVVAEGSFEGQAQTSSTQSETSKIAKEAFSLMADAASRNDQKFLNEIPKDDENCPWCDEFYSLTRQELGNSELSSDLRSFFARALAKSGNPQNVNAVAELMQASATQGELGTPVTYGQALEDVELEPEQVDEISAGLNSPNPYLVDMVVSILTKQGTLEAAERLYQHTTEVGDPDGYHRDGNGLGFMHPQPEAIPYLEELVRQRDQFSHLAVKALLNSGPEGIDRVVALLAESSDYQTSRRMLLSASDHIPTDPATLQHMQMLATSAKDRAVKEMARTVLKEHQIELEQMERVKRDPEYNENYDKGIVQDDVADNRFGPR